MTQPKSRWSRRGFAKRSLGFLSAAIGARLFGLGKTVSLDALAPVEYIVVGSGAGGGPLACRLALAGHKVVLFEAGGNNYPFTANVPPFAATVTEDPSIAWDYWVRHYGDTTQQTKDTKYVAAKDPNKTGGVWYPRVGAIGGCTIHSALISMYPSDSDWADIAQLTGDSSWDPAKMRTYFQRIENCSYVPRQEDDPAKHGFFGWLPTAIADPMMFVNDTMVVRFIKAALEEIYQTAGKVAEKFQGFFDAKLDPNDARLQGQGKRDGYYNIALWAARGQRRSVRDFILATAEAVPNNLIIQKDTLVTRVLFDGTIATGVEYMAGARLYRADQNPAATAPARQRMTASREVIISAGAFNSPQLLKLSGIGPKEELARHGITTIVDLPGVGENLQDRYEVGVVTEQALPFLYAPCNYFADLDTDKCAAEWFRGTGPYTTTGVYGGIYSSDVARNARQVNPDLFIFGAAAQFRGYYPGYSSQDVAAFQNRHTWLLLKAYTVNRAGTVTLRSADPRDTPVINFRYFDEGSQGSLDDLAAMADGVDFVRRISTRVAGISNDKVWPGPEVRSRKDIEDWIRNEAWGHHASCTNKMGPATDRLAVVDSKFQVHGTKGLRVVDASIFPRIPGYFVLAPIYMASEKAADVILASAG